MDFSDCLELLKSCGDNTILIQTFLEKLKSKNYSLQQLESHGFVEFLRSTSQESNDIIANLKKSIISQASLKSIFFFFQIILFFFLLFYFLFLGKREEEKEVKHYHRCYYFNIKIMFIFHLLIFTIFIFSIEIT